MEKSLLKENLLNYIKMMKMNMKMTFVVDVVEEEDQKKIIK